MSERLLSLQQNFISYLHDSANSFAGQVADGGHLAVEKRLHIYHHAYRARLIEVLQDSFERTWAYLGDEAFEAAARDFVESHPSKLRTLHGFGAQFPAWLGTAYVDDGEVAEIAMLDWRMREAFDAADETPLTLDAFAILNADAWALLKLRFHSSLSVVPVSWNSASIWEAIEREAPPPTAATLQTPGFLMVWRKDLRPHFVSADAFEASVIRLFAEGRSFAEVGECVSAEFPEEDIVARVGLALQRWVSEEMLVVGA